MTVENRHTHKRIRLRIPKNYHQEPVISHLISDYGLTVNISAAILAADAVSDGWFDLDLQGTTVQIEDALTYVNDLDLEIWEGIDVDGW